MDEGGAGISRRRANSARGRGGNGSGSLRAVRHAIIGLLALAPAAASAQAPQAPEDATELERAAHAVLETHCARCHQEGMLGEGLERAKGGIGDILDLRRLVADPKLVNVDEPASSKLTQVIGPYAYPSMPDDCALSQDPEGCFPTDAEIAALTEWLSNLEEEERGIVTIAREHAIAAEDLRGVPTNRQGDVRYVSFRVQHNDGRLSGDELAAHRRGAIKTLNALSTAPRPVTDDPEGAREVVLRLRLSDLGWDAADWDALERIYPYGASDPADADLTHLQRATGARVAGDPLRLARGLRHRPAALPRAARPATDLPGAAGRAGHRREPQTSGRGARCAPASRTAGSPTTTA